MTAVDPSNQQSVTIRIVLDGAPHSGKTAATYTLSSALGEDAFTPAEDAGRTLWFDWMNYTAGRHDGRPIRVELVTVPGHIHDRRRHLLGWADVVMFVVDTTEEHFAESVAHYERLRQDMADLGEMPVVVLANKRDLDDVVSIEQVRSELGLADDESVIEGVATSGSGIRQAFIFAVRAALATSSDPRFDETSASELLSAMKSELEAAEAGSESAPVSEATLGEVTDELFADVVSRARALERDLHDVLAEKGEQDLAVESLDFDDDSSIDQDDASLADDPSDEAAVADEAANEAAAVEETSDELVDEAVADEVANEAAAVEEMSDELVEAAVADEVANEAAAVEEISDELVDEAIADEVAVGSAEDDPADDDVVSAVEETVPDAPAVRSDLTVTPGAEEEFSIWLDAATEHVVESDSPQKIDQARGVADAILREARARAANLTEAAIARAEELHTSASARANEAVEAERKAYRNRATEIIERAIADSEVIVADARRRAEQVEADAAFRTQTSFAQLEDDLAEREKLAQEKVEALARDGEAELERAKVEANDIIELSRVEAQTMLDDARAERDSIMKAIETLNTDAESRLMAAMAVASEEATANARRDIEQQLIDSRNDVERLREEASASVRNTESDAERVRYEAHARAAVAAKQALVKVDVDPAILASIDAFLATLPQPGDAASVEE